MNEVKEQIEEAALLEILQSYLNEKVFIEHPSTLEHFSQSLPSIIIRGEQALEKGKANILGEYIAIFPFAIALRISSNEGVEYAYRFFEKLTAFFEVARSSQSYPDLKQQRVCLDITMTSNPVLEKENEDGSEDYMAIFTVKYQKSHITNRRK